MNCNNVTYHRRGIFSICIYGSFSQDDKVLERVEDVVSFRLTLARRLSATDAAAAGVPNGDETSSAFRTSLIKVF